MRLFLASGGLRYHWRAFRHRRRWRPFVRDVAAWLAGWDAGRPELILIGPSGGHTLTSPFLARFARVHAYDLDPLAPLVFRLRHPRARVRFYRRDVFWRDGTLAIGALDEILARHPGAAVLFSNVIGQVLLEGTADEDQWLRYLAQVRTRLEGRPWASYHDVFSYEGNQATDHLTSGSWTGRLPRRTFEWALTATSRHRIEGVRWPVAEPAPARTPADRP